MTESQIKSKSKEELQSILIDIYRSPLIPIYFSIKKQLDNLAKEIENADITLGSKSYENFIKWAEKSLVFGENIQGLLSKIDPETLRKETEIRLKADDLSPESFAIK